MSSDAPPKGRLARLRLVGRMTAEQDPRFLPYLALAAGVGLILGTGVGLLVGPWPVALLVGVLFALLGVLVVFNQRVSRAQIAAIEGRPGAAAGVLQSMRGRWQLTPAVAVTRKQDLVHRVVGRPGVVLVGEGAPSRTAALLKQEQRKVQRVVGETPVRVVQVGDGPDHVALGQLAMHLAKMPRVVKTKELPTIEQRLAAVPGGQVPLPKGPMPRPPRGRMR